MFGLSAKIFGSCTCCAYHTCCSACNGFLDFTPCKKFHGCSRGDCSVDIKFYNPWGCVDRARLEFTRFCDLNLALPTYKSNYFECLGKQPNLIDHNTESELRESFSNLHLRDVGT